MKTQQLDDPADLDEALELSLGRRAPFTQLGDWVLLSGSDSDARTLYWGLSAHLNVVRDDDEVWPGLLSLARILGLKKPENVSKYMLQLEVIGAIEVIRTAIGLVRRNRYVIHQTPPASHTGPQSTAEWYALNRGPKDEAPEARKAREAQFDAWLAAVRDGLKAHCDKVSKERAAAKKAKAAMPRVELFRAPVLNDFRTPASGGTGRPATTRKTAGRSVPPRQGVPYPRARGLKKTKKNKTNLSLVPAVTAAQAETAEGRKTREINASRDTTPAPADASVPHPRPEAKSSHQPQLPLDLQPVMQAYITALGVYPTQGMAEQLRQDALELLKLSWPVEHVAKLASQLPGLGYSSLAKHAGHNPPPAPKAASRGASLPWCTECESPDYRWIAPEDGPAKRCTACNPAVAVAAP